MNNKLISVLTGTSIATLGMLSVSTGANAATLTHSYTITNQSVPFTEAFTLPSFNSSLGTLNSIVITNVVDSTADVDIINTTGATQSFTNATASVPIDITGPGVNFTTTPSTTIASGTLAPNSTTNFPGLPLNDTGTFNVTNFTPYIGSGSSLVNFTAQSIGGTFSGNSVTGVFFGGSAESGAEVSITYTYNPPDIAVTPEPTSLLGLGLIGGLGLLVKRKK